MGLQRMWLAEGTYFCTTNEALRRRATASASRMLVLACPHLTLLSEACGDNLCELVPAGESVHAQFWTWGWRKNCSGVAIWQQFLLIHIHKANMERGHTWAAHNWAD